MKKNTRLKDSFSALELNNIDKVDLCFIKCSSDTGVRLNLGRAGARFSPNAIIEVFKKMSHHNLKSKFTQIEVSDSLLEKSNFKKSQIKESGKIFDLIQKEVRFIHLGGGHDHIFPLLKALDDKYDELFYIVNLDAHLDTRIDNIHHSGTPFRDFDRISSKKHKLIQYGIHNYSNSDSTFSKLENLDQVSYEKGNKDFYDEISKIPKESFVLLSLDADAIDSSQMQAVSAVNHNGIKLEEIRNIIKLFKKHKLILGIYEYNPIYDDLSQKGAKNLSSLIYEFLL